MENDRLVIHQVNYDGDGSTQLYYARTADDNVFGWDGSLIFHQDGSITFKAFTDTDVGYVATIKDNRLVVRDSEDQCTMKEIIDSRFDGVVFDSEELK